MEKQYAKYRLINYARLVKKKLKRFKLSALKRYAGKPLLSAEQGNEVIRRAVEAGKPFAAVRYGCNELATTIDCADMKLGLRKEIRDECMLSLCRNAGFFPKDKALAYRFGTQQAELAGQADLFGIWSWNMEDYAIATFGAPDCQVCIPRALEPYYFAEPWTAALAGKRVLVIHPFEKSIRSQYEKRTQLFENPDVLPEFTLLTLKAVQSAAYNETPFDTWFDALQYMYDEAMKLDFDVAILGCGAYGLSLACMLKKAGRTAIHMGGATQILFGIKGNRWDDHPVISKLYNQHWVRPLPEETPEKAKAVEGACYW